MKDSIKHWIMNAFIIGFAFWATDGLLSFMGGILSTKIWIIIKTIALPVVSVAVLKVITNRGTQTALDISASAFLSVLALWILSPLYLIIMSIFSEKGIMELKDLGWLLFAFPVTAIMVSTYSGGLMGMILASFILPTAGIIMGRKIKKS